MSIDRAALTAAVAAHGCVARVVVAETGGSAPREAGAAMLVWPGGQSGTIGGGALEFQAAEAARKALASGAPARLARIPLGPAMGQCCGGAVTLLTEVFDAQAVAALPDLVFARRISGPQDMPLVVRRLLAEARNSGRQTRARLVSGWMIEPVCKPAQRLWVFGAGHVGRAIVATVAPLPGFAITWVDCAADRFPDAIPAGVTPLVAANPADAAAHAPREAHHLILTFSHALDLELCHRLLGHGFASAGLIGSATKWARFRSRLAQLGHSNAQISRIRCPIGQPELGKHPQAIAVGVTAALVLQAKAEESEKDATG